jgi:serine/threonine-protein kinase
VLLRPLSRGGMGEVFLATSGEISGFEKLCVIKKVLPHLAEDGDFIRRFIDEAQVAIKLAHANIASVFEVGMVDDEYFLALEYVEGKDLRRTLARLHERGERLPIELALFIVREVASGLAYAHRKADSSGAPMNLVHCDISPPNVLVSYEGEVKIIDFGIAKSAIRMTATNPRTGFGKLGYMAPEQLLRGGVVDKRTDLYAAGVLLYELLTGERLFPMPEGFDYKEVARAVTQGRHPLPSHRDPRLYDFDPIVVKALSVDQKKRYQSAEELRDDVAVALARVNPTVTGDKLGTVIQRLFAEEVADERRAHSSAAGFDFSSFADELTNSRTHTVSFALAVAPDGGAVSHVGPVPAPPRPPSLPLPAMPARAETFLVDKTTPRERTGPRRRRGVVIGAAAVVTLAVGGLAFALVSRAPTPRPSPALAAAPPPTPPPSVPTIEPLVVEPLPADAVSDAAPPVVEPLKPARPAAAERPKARPKAPVKPAVKNPAKTPERPKEVAAPTGDAVESKFIAVKKEYGVFRKAYGQRLDEDWNDILDLATYGRGDDRLRKLSTKLDRFRQRMAEIKAGG